jgi:hypothetical protein
VDEDEKENLIADEEVLKLLRDSLKMKLKEDRKLPTKIQLNRALNTTIMEFMSCYKLMGYDLNGDLVILSIHNNKLEESALDNLFVQEFGKFMSSRTK